MVKYGRDRDPVVGDPLGDVGVESDCEGDSSKVADGVPGVPEGRETALSRAILTVGSFFFFFFMFVVYCAEVGTTYFTHYVL